MCDSRRPLEGADSEPRATGFIIDEVHQLTEEDLERLAPVPPVERMIQEYLPEATRWPVWRDRAVNGGWDRPQNLESVEAES